MATVGKGRDTYAAVRLQTQFAVHASMAIWQELRGLGRHT